MLWRATAGCGRGQSGWRAELPHQRIGAEPRGEGLEVSVYGVRDHFMVLGDGYPTKPAFKDEALIGELRLDRIEVAPLLPFAQKFWLLFGTHRAADTPFGAQNGA